MNPGFFDGLIGPKKNPAKAEPKFIAGSHENFVSFAFHELPIQKAKQHFAIVGKSGSGKTILIRLLLQSIAARFTRDAKTPARLIVLDPKGDMPQLLGGMGLTPETTAIFDLHPFREGCARWDLASDITSPAEAQQFATALVPPAGKESTPFFTDNARLCVRAALLALMATAGRQWMLRDLIMALRTKDRLARLTAQVPEAAEMVESALRDEKYVGTFFSTLRTRLAPIEIVAGLWHQMPRAQKFSLREFLTRDSGVLILGHERQREAVIDPITTLLLRFATNILVDGPEAAPSGPPLTWFVLDEFRGFNDEGAVSILLNEGRSKGVSVLIGIQGIEGMHAKFASQGLPEVIADELIGQCDSRCFLKLSPKTAKWVAEEMFGQRRIFEVSYGETSGGQQGNTTSRNTALQERLLFLASTFTGLPPVEEGEFVAFTDVRSEIVIKRRPFADVKAQLKPADPKCAKPARSVDHQRLKPWTAAEEKFYCPPLESEKPPGPPRVPKIRPTRPNS
jgi:type IV secretory pathway TraG/TraD family ATPase VirD4